MVEIRWHGRGGQGAFTAARLLGAMAVLYGDQHALSFPSFGPERRGAPVCAYTKIHRSRITDRSEIKACDYIVVLDETLVEQQMFQELKPGGAILINTAESKKYTSTSVRVFTIDALALSLEVLRKPITNTAMLGALLGVSHIVSIEGAVLGLQESLEKTLVAKNVEILRRAYEALKEDCHV